MPFVALLSLLDTPLLMSSRNGVQDKSDLLTMPVSERVAGSNYRKELSVNDAHIASSLRGEILKILYVQGATQGENMLNSFYLWGALHEWGNANGGRPLLRETIEALVDELAARAFVQKIASDPYDYEVCLTSVGQRLLKGQLPPERDIQIPDIKT